ncbi:MAG: S8 family serine peptidase [Muribaculaceae bacterium]|nr:S8 family serine peptidase [Muribaculaceae bacterium]
MKRLTAALLFSGMILNISADTADPEYYSEIIRLDASDPEGHLEEMLLEGGIMLNRRADIALMLLPTGIDDEKGDEKRRPGCRAPRRVYPSRPRLTPQPTMDYALPVSGVDRIVTGTGLPRQYDGTGVVVGLCDIGMDTRHANFTDADGNLRISRLVKYTESEGLREQFDTPEEILAIHTDDAEKTHATHVAGIMAGSFPVWHHSNTGSQTGIRGIASGAEIVVSTSELTDAGLLAGVEDIIAYAKEVGKPAVINLSMGNYTGPHDGSSLFCQYLDMCAEDAIICLSSGNEGSHTNHQYLPDASQSKFFRTRIAGSDWVNLTLYGQTDIYAADNTPFTLALRITDSTRDTDGGLYYELPEVDFSETPFVVFSSSERPGMPEWICHPGFADHFSGEVYVTGGQDPENGRSYANVVYNCTTQEPFSDEKRWARYRLELIARPTDVTRLDAFADGTRSWLANWHGNLLPPGNEISVSDLATGHKTISVGMYCTGRDISTSGGQTFASEFDTPLMITNYSSYGVLPDGRRLPLTVAPGMPIMSSLSGAYIKEHGTDEASLWTTDATGKVHFWGPMTGTSMSCPFVAGTIATWLQADPTLTWHDVMALIADTNYYPSFVASGPDPRYGSGIFDGYKAMENILLRTGVSGVTLDTPDLTAYTEGGTLRILNPSGAELALGIYNLQGMELHRIYPGSNLTHTIPLSDFTDSSSSPLIIRISTPSGRPLILKTLAH